MCIIYTKAFLYLLIIFICLSTMSTAPMVIVGMGNISVLIILLNLILIPITFIIYKKGKLKFGYDRLKEVYEGNKKYFAPPMSFSQIVNITESSGAIVYNIAEFGSPELNCIKLAKGECSDPFLVTFYLDKNSGNHRSISSYDILNMSDKCVLIMPKTRKDYVKLCDYYSKNKDRADYLDTSRKQIENLNKLRSAIDEMQDKYTEQIFNAAKTYKKINDRLK